jgi:exodeoxyribonuclease-3
MRLISWNVNGLRAIVGKGFLDFMTEADADVICLQEIKAREEQVAEIPWPAGYHRFWNSAQKPGYSGTAIFSRIAPVSVRSGIGSELHDREGRVITAEFEAFFLVNVYVPNSQRELTRLSYRTESWEPAFLAFLKDLEKMKPVIVCGDLNVAHREIDLARPKDNVKNAGFTPEERSCFQKVIDAGFIDTFRLRNPDAGGHYTWWSYMNQARVRNIGWRIDYFCISPSLEPMLHDAFIWPHVQGSDHCPVGVDLY